MKTLTQRILRCFHTVIFPKVLAFGVFFMKLFGDKHYCKQLKISLLQYPPGTVGHEMLCFFERYGFDFVPYYEKHDLKHVLLGYDATAPDEMRMQAFMFGNAGFRPFIKLFTIIFLIWTPDVWRELPYHFLIGRFTKPIGGLRVEDLAHRDLQEVRNEIGLMEAIWKADLLMKGLRAQPSH
jgi:ubiquinone biosynthesis protein Coq4